MHRLWFAAGLLLFATHGDALGAKVTCINSFVDREQTKPLIVAGLENDGLEGGNADVGVPDDKVPLAEIWRRINQVFLINDQTIDLHESKAVANACAGRDIGNRRAIWINTEWLEEYSKGDYWVKLVVIAHELGHLINDDDQQLTQPWPKEVNADKFAGKLVRLLGGQQANARLAVSGLPKRGLHAHPDAAIRLVSILEGYGAPVLEKFIAVADDDAAMLIGVDGVGLPGRDLIKGMIVTPIRSNMLLFTSTMGTEVLDYTKANTCYKVQSIAVVTPGSRWFGLTEVDCLDDQEFLPPAAVEAVGIARDRAEVSEGLLGCKERIGLTSPAQLGPPTRFIVRNRAKTTVSILRVSVEGYQKFKGSIASGGLLKVESNKGDVYVFLDSNGSCVNGIVAPVADAVFDLING